LLYLQPRTHLFSLLARPGRCSCRAMA
jgi:hypothetical protein